MFERRDDVKIAVIGEKCGEIEGFAITWFDSKPNDMPSDFDFVIDISGSNVFITFWDEKKCEILCEDKEVLLQQLISLIVDEKYVDIDIFDINVVMKEKCTFKSYISSVDDICSVLHERDKSSCKSAFAYINGDFSLLDLKEIVKELSNNILVLYGAKLDESMNREVRVSLWY